MLQRKLLCDYLDQNVDTLPAYTFLGDHLEGTWRTWGDLREKAKAVAGWLQNEVPAGRPVLLIMEPSEDFYLAFLACVYAGYPAVPIPVPKNLAKGELPESFVKVAVQCNAGALLTSDLLAKALPLFTAHLAQAGLNVLCSTVRQSAAAGVGFFRYQNIKTSDLALIQFTSGSTSNPSGVKITQSQLVDMLSILGHTVHVPSDNFGVLWLPYTHNTGLLALLTSVPAQFPIAYLSPQSFMSKPSLWLKAISKFRATVSGAPNFALDLCVKMIKPEECEGIDLSSWQAAFSGGEPLSQSSLRKFADRFAPFGFKESSFLPLYGMSEATLLITGSKNVEFPRTKLINGRDVVSCGRPVDGVHVEIVDPENLAILGPDQVGEIWASGGTIAQGYIGDETKTKNTFNQRLPGYEDDYLRTGDLGMLHDGELFVVGRIKEIFVFQGRKFHAQDLEGTLRQTFSVFENIILLLVAVQEKNRDCLQLLIELPPEGVDAITAIEAMVPKITATLNQKHDVSLGATCFLVQGALPRTESGKLQRYKAQDLAQSGALPVYRRVSSVDSASAKGPPPKTPADSDQQRNRETHRGVLRAIKAALAAELGVEAFDEKQPFAEFGLSSLSVMTVSAALEREFKIPISPNLFFEYPTIESLAWYLADQRIEQQSEVRSEIPAGEKISTVGKSSDNAAETEFHSMDIAIIGYACRLPGADSPQEFWQNLAEGVCSIREVPAERWDAKQFLGPFPPQPGKMYSAEGGFLKGSIKLFDPKHFGISPVEAERMDPQQRLLLELSWEAMEHSGNPPSTWRGTNTGVWVGVSSHDYGYLQGTSGVGVNRYTGAGSAHSICANRLSYSFDLKGPSLSVDTACSSSLVALHLAVESLRSGRADSAIVGGVNMILTPELNIVFSDAQMLSPSGRCKSFDNDADGYVRGEGGVVLLLKSLSKAQADGDMIHAVIKGIAVNQDGATNGLTAPHPRAQIAVIRAALTDAKLAPEDIQLIEAHGTGTKLGDPIEYGALLEVFRSEKRPSPCFLGAVKSNIGHLEAAAGLASVLKVVLAFKAHQIPASLHFRNLSSQIKTKDPDTLEMASELKAWPTSDHHKRIAGVSSFGFGGTNVHVVLSEANSQRPAVHQETIASRQADSMPLHEPTAPAVLVVSARSQKALHSDLRRVAQWIEGQSAAPLDLIAKALWHGREHLEHRVACVVDCLAGRSRQDISREVHRALEKSQNDPWTKRAGPRISLIKGYAARTPPKILFAFSGQGTQIPKGAPWLYGQHQGFRQQVDQCLKELSEPLATSIRAFFLSQPSDELPATDLFQPLVYIFQVAALRWLSDLGIKPDGVVGHSLGELAAATAAGGLSISEGLAIAVERGKLMERTEPGKMVAVLGPHTTVAQIINDWQDKQTDSEMDGDRGNGFLQLQIAAYNGPKITVVSGLATAVDSFCQLIQSQGHRVRPLPVTKAFHSALMDPILDSFQTFVEQHTTLKRLEKPFYSTLTGRSVETLDSAYWRQQIRQPTRFQDAIEQAISDGYQTVVEIGADHTLTGIITSMGMPIDLCLPLFDSGVAPAGSLAFLRAAFWTRGVGTSVPVGDGVNGVNGVNGHPADTPDSTSRDQISAKPWKSVAASLPPKSYATEVCWIPTLVSKPDHPTPIYFSKTEAPMVIPSSPPKTILTAESVLKQITSDVCHLLGSAAETFDPSLPLIEMGADSLIMMEALAKIEDRYRVSIPINRLFNDLTHAKALADFIVAEHTPLVPTQGLAEKPSSGPAETSLFQSMSPVSINGSNVNGHSAAGGMGIIQEHIRLMNLHMTYLLGSGVELKDNQTKPDLWTPPRSAAVLDRSATPSHSDHQMTQRPKDRFDAMMPDKSNDASGLDAAKKEHLAKLITEFNHKTSRSKEFSAKYRQPFADNRSSSGFRLPLKEMIYPIVMERSQGAKIWDIDGNQYSDFTMGFGVNLFGHNDPDILQAIRDQLEKGFAVGPQAELAGEVAVKLTRMTGMERVVFTNSGTEAVMTAVRLARTVTGRQKVAIFTNSYHGTFDGVLGRARFQDPLRSGTPVSPGVPQSLVQDLVVLDYGTPEALDFVRKHGHQLAAVMVEPVQSRYPENHFGEFLRDLRKITESCGSALIFDEVITGFRTGPGGAQEFFGVKADIATYGKVLGGGMPIGAVAGSAKFIDPIDGGVWHYGDHSVPEKDLTFFAGTFCKHPLAMAAALATLAKLEAGQGNIQKSLNKKVLDFTTGLNEWFAQESLPVQLSCFGSLFRFGFKGNLDLLFFQLVQRGIYIWEGRNLFISTAHDDQDFERFSTATKQALLDLREAGFIGEKSPGKKS